MTTITKIRVAIAIVIFGLVVSGLTAVPLLHELNLLSYLAVGSGASLSPGDYSGVTHWILKVREGLDVTYARYPFIAYGTDWLAFGHIIIALFFILPFRDPVRYLGVLEVAVIACILVVPLALICGQIRGIPTCWRLIDCMFGILCLAPLIYAIRTSRKLAYETANNRGSGTRCPGLQRT